MKPPIPLSSLSFESKFVDALPEDSNPDQFPHPVLRASYSKVRPTPVAKPKLIGWSETLGNQLGILRPDQSDRTAAEILSGNRILQTMKPYSARYGGHQFGHWAGQLGDGRAITLGELRDPNQKSWEIQLKGAGLTPYSRTADGRAVLRSSVREFLCSEAMHHLGVPTTRALSLVTTGEEVIRDMFYDGNPQAEKGAIVCRVAPTFIRFGNFEILADYSEFDLLKRLLNYVITEHFPELGAPSPSAYEKWFSEVCSRTALMVAHWLRVGFVHGVMNTDNMSILGLTIDYGPYGWLEGYDPTWTPNTTDSRHGRYCFGRQPAIALWNLKRLAESLKVLFEQMGIADALEKGLNDFQSTFDSTHRKMLSDKLGLSGIQTLDDETLVNELFTVLGQSETDMTLFFRNLSALSLEKVNTDPLKPSFYSALSEPEETLLKNWVQKYLDRVKADSLSNEERLAKMQFANPKYVLRNYLAQKAIEAADQGDDSVIEELLTVLRNPYSEQPQYENYAQKRPEWARHKPGCSALSCSS